MGKHSPTNATLSVVGYGSLGVRIKTISFGFDMLTSNSESRMFRTLYTRAITEEAFGLGLICTTHEEYELLGMFLLNYGRKAAQGTAGMMRVRFPARNFDRLGVPDGSTFGRAVPDVTWPMAVGFTGASDLVNLGSRDVTTLSNVLGAEYLNSIHKDPASAYYYPTGSQLTGAGSGADLLYDTPPDTTVRPPIIGGGSRTAVGIE